MPKKARLIEAPQFGEGDILFTLKDVVYSPENPVKNEPFTVRGKIELLKLPFVAPIWIQARVTYPEEFWEEIIPIIGAPRVAEGQMALGGDFNIEFPKGFDREGEFILEVEAYAGPTYSLDSITLPPFPPMAKETTTFIVAGEAPEEAERTKDFIIVSYGKNGETPVVPPDVLELDVGDKCRVNVSFGHTGAAIEGKFHAAIWQPSWWDPHDEVLNAEKVFTTPSTARDEWETFEDHIDIPITSGIEPGDYGLYVKIMGITGADVFTEYLENVIRIVGVPAEYFTLGRPTTQPPGPQDNPIDPDTDIVIRCPVISHYLEAKTITAKCIVYEGSFFPGHGTKLIEYTSTPVSIGPGEAMVLEFPHRTIVGTIDRRDVEVEVYVAGRKVKESEWDDVFYVTEAIEMELLEVKIDPPGAGYVTVTPEPSSGTQHNWYFPHGTVVYVTAHPSSGYVFKSWSGEMKDTTAVTAPVYPMTEKRTITAHFEPAVAEKCAYIAPIQEGGHVESSPAPNSIEKAWFGEIWCYDEGTRVDLTAIPDPGYKWVRWSFLSEVANRDINPTYMYMTEDRGATARVIVAEFELVVPEPPTSDIKNFDFLATKGTYKLGDTVPFTAPYEYRGKAQGGYLTISLGTGVYPSFFTKHTFPRIPVVFQEAMDWTRSDLEGQFVIPATMEEGQTYSVRAKLETADGKQETDTDWSTFDIAAPPEAQLEIVSARFS